MYHPNSTLEERVEYYLEQGDEDAAVALAYIHDYLQHCLELPEHIDF